MKKSSRNILLLAALSIASLCDAQVLNVSVVNNGNNQVQIKAMATSPGFDAPPNNAWASMNLTWRIPKTATSPAPTVAPPASTPEITAENTAFTGASPRDAFNNSSLDLTMFDLTSFGQPDDGYWYFQVTGTTGDVQDISTGSEVILYEFTTPYDWFCLSCVELLTFDVPGLPISTTSFIDNAGLGMDVLNLVDNLGPLPVRFLTFEAHKKDNNEVELDWKVSNEENVRGYYVERSGNGRDWQAIGFVPFQSASSSVNEYSLTDRDPLDNINYYRIRQEDIDSRRSYSVTRIVRMDVNSLLVHLYPVPVKNTLSVNIQSPLNAPAIIKITDMLGRIVHRSNIVLSKGSQTRGIPVNELNAGTYIIEIQSNDLKWSGKFIKE